MYEQVIIHFLFNDKWNLYIEKLTSIRNVTQVLGKKTYLLLNFQCIQKIHPQNMTIICIEIQ